MYGTPYQKSPSVFFLGVRLDNLDGHAAMERVRRYVAARDGAARMVFFTNVHSIHLAQGDAELRSTINRADMVLPDGAGVNLAGRMLGQPVRENLNGTDFIPKILSRAAAAGWSVYLFGARPDVLDACRSRIEARYPRLRIVGHHHGYASPAEERGVLEDIGAKRPDILLVALGSPRQEAWIARNVRRLNARVCFAVGGLFDFISGDKRRAPLWVRRLGMEWLFRLILDPKEKWDRTMIEIPVFLTRVFFERLFPGHSGPSSRERA